MMNLVVLFLILMYFKSCQTGEVRFAEPEECKLPPCRRSELNVNCSGGPYVLWPWIGRLIFEQEPNTVAFGFLITNKHLITRVVHAKKNPKKVIFGTTQTTGRSRVDNCSHRIDYYTITNAHAPKLETFKVKQCIAHESYEKRANWYDKNDIAIIELENFVEYNDYIKPLCLPTYRGSHLYENDFADLAADTAGWNMENHSPEKTRLTLYESNLVILENEKCVDPREEMVELGSIFCATSISNRGAIVDDRGFPIVAYLNGGSYAIGLIMRTQDPILYKNEKVLMTRLTKYADWIETAVGVSVKIQPNSSSRNNLRSRSRRAK